MVSGNFDFLDVVKKGIEKLNGTISIDSEIDKGTRITIKLPLTLAIIQALMVYVGDEIYAIPINSIFETRRIEPEEIFMVENKDVIKIREEIVSLIYLSRVFSKEKDDQIGQKKKNMYVVVVSAGENKAGLVIDSLIGEQDIVIKPLNNKLTKVPGIAGAAILGNGDISLIIDVNQMIEYKKELDKNENMIQEELL